jgi:hypothetical protein
MNGGLSQTNYFVTRNDLQLVYSVANRGCRSIGKLMGVRQDAIGGDHRSESDRRILGEFGEFARGNEPLL